MDIFFVKSNRHFQQKSTWLLYKYFSEENIELNLSGKAHREFSHCKSWSRLHPEEFEHKLAVGDMDQIFFFQDFFHSTTYCLSIYFNTSFVFPFPSCQCQRPSTDNRRDLLMGIISAGFPTNSLTFLSGDFVDVWNLGPLVFMTTIPQTVHACVAERLKCLSIPLQCHKDHNQSPRLRLLTCRAISQL